MRWILAGVVLGLGLGCAGEGSVVGAQQRALALRKSEAGCEWIEWSAAVGEQVTLMPGSCPTELAMGGGQVVMYGGRELSVATLPELQDRRSLPLPALEADWSWMGVDASGVAHVQGRTQAKEKREGRDLVLTAGDVQRVVSGGAPEGQRAELIVHYATALEPLAWELVDAKVELLADMQDYSPYTLPEGGWREPEPPVDCAQDPGACRSERWKDRNDLRALYPDRELGYLAEDEGWLFGLRKDEDGGAVIEPPVYACHDFDCTERTELQDLPESAHGLQMSIYWDFLLITGSSETRAYQSMNGEPIHVFKGAKARWNL